MQKSSILFRSIFSRKISLVIAASIAALFTGAMGATPAQAHTLEGKVVSSTNQGLSNYNVSLYASFVGERHAPPRPGSHWRRIGFATTNNAGVFHIFYTLPPWPSNDEPPLLFVEAEHGAVMLASAIGAANNVPRHIVVNPRTTVATGNAFAQFIDGREIEGNPVGMINAVHMAANLANPETGDAGIVLSLTPNGTDTTTFATFNSLANAVGSCVADASNCATLFHITKPTRGPAPTNVLQAVANIVKSPSYPGYSANAPDPLFELSQIDPVYTPALPARPTNWLLFLKFTGGFYSAQLDTNLMNGPGNVAFDADGYAWVNDNYVPQEEDHFACAGMRVIKFYPWGKNFPTSPYIGGGLSGAGYGITLDPSNHVWVGNFGFEDPPCKALPQAAQHNSVSEFYSNGKPVSSSGFTIPQMSWPQGMASDREGNIWVANCANDSVTKIPHGHPSWASNISLLRHHHRSSDDDPQVKPFGVAVDLEGNVWVVGNRSGTVSVISPDGKLVETLPSTYHGKTVLSHPVGNAADSKGNIWVANSDWLDNPCPASVQNLGTATHPSVTMFQMKQRRPYPHSPFTGGGLTLPWGIAVDGDDTVWVFNFGVVPPPGRTNTIPTGISRFCGINTKKCPANLHVGDPISPDTGYRSNALTRITGGQIDPSGNIWLMNNWKLVADPYFNPGGNSIVIVVGAAGPLKTPLTGAPVPFN